MQVASLLRGVDVEPSNELERVANPHSEYPRRDHFLRFAELERIRSSLDAQWRIRIEHVENIQRQIQLSVRAE